MKRFILISGAIVMALSWGAGNAFAEPPSPQPTAKVPEEVDLPVDISIDIVKSGDEVPKSTTITIDMKNEKSGKDIHLILPRRGGNGDHRGPDEHSVVTSTPAQTGVPDEHGSNPVDFDDDFSHPDHSDTPVADVPDVEVPGNAAPDMETPIAEVPEPGDMPGETAPDIETPVATPPHIDTPEATVPDLELPGNGMSNPHTSRH